TATAHAPQPRRHRRYRRVRIEKRLRTTPVGLRDGLGTTAAVALTVLTGAAVAFIGWIELDPIPDLFRYDELGPFASTATIIWSLWIITAFTAAVLPGRITRF